MNLLNSPPSWPQMYLVILLRYLIVASIAYLIFYTLKKKEWAYKKIQQKLPTRKDYLREITFSFITVFIFAGVGYILFFTSVRSHTMLYSKINDYGWPYYCASIVFMLVLHDTYFYWTHRAMHHPLVFKWFHKTHHLSTNPSPWAAYAFHPLESIVEAGIIVLIAFLIPFHRGAMSLFLLLMIVYNVYGHLGFELYPKGFSKSKIGRWINTSVNHNQHHHFYKGNYGLYFLWWDRWMGTIRGDYDQEFEAVKSRKP